MFFVNNYIFSAACIRGQGEKNPMRKFRHAHSSISWACKSSPWLSCQLPSQSSLSLDKCPHMFSFVDSCLTMFWCFFGEGCQFNNALFFFGPRAQKHVCHSGGSSVSSFFPQRGNENAVRSFTTQRAVPTTFFIY